MWSILFKKLYKDPTEISERRVQPISQRDTNSVDKGKLHQIFRSDQASHTSKIGNLCSEKKITFIFALASFYENGDSGGGWNFVLGVPRGPPNYLVLTPSFEFWLEIFQCCQKWFFEALIIDGLVSSGHLGLQFLPG